MKWYAIQVHSNYELKAKTELVSRIERLGYQDKFGEILIPTEEVLSHNIKGKTRKRTKASYPGYMFVEMDLTDDTYHVIKGTEKVTGFIGNQRPQEVSKIQVEQIRKVMAGETLKPKGKSKFKTGDQIKVIKGAFENFSGAVQEVSEEKQKIKVMVNIFGRETPVELGFMDVAVVG